MNGYDDPMKQIECDLVRVMIRPKFNNRSSS